MIKVDIKWEESFIACGESDLTEEILKTLVEAGDGEKYRRGDSM